jgi:hypothetical protein
MALKHIIIYFETQRTKILDGKDSCGSSVALTKGFLPSNQTFPQLFSSQHKKGRHSSRLEGTEG